MADDLVPEVPLWLEAYARRLGVEPPSEDEIALLLSLASAAARGSARQAAPIACWMAARAGCSLDEALAIASSVDG